MKNKFLILVIGESTGLECFKVLLKKKYLTISYVISVDSKYNFIIKKLCKNYKINFISKKKFIKNNKIKFYKNKKYILLSIFSNLILKESFLKKFNGSAYNFHPAILPQYPGKNCVSGTLYNDEKTTGVSIHIITKNVDAGPILKIAKLNINQNETLIQLMYRLKLLTINLIKNFALKLKFNKKFIKKKNNFILKKNFPKYIPNKGLINADTKYKEFLNTFRASNFGPFKNTWGKTFFIYKKKKIYILKIEKILKNSKNQIKFAAKINKKKYSLKFDKNIVIVLSS